jgi:hypothetical protein
VAGALAVPNGTGDSRPGTASLPHPDGSSDLVGGARRR